MKTYFRFFLAVILLTGLFLTGCSDNNSSSPTSVTETGTGVVEGQLVAEVGSEFAKIRTATTRATSNSPVYPISGATVELLQNGSVIATTTTDEYGRFRFVNLPAGEYEVRVVANDGSVAHYRVVVNTDQTVAVFGRVVSGECAWYQENGPHWDGMQQGQHWGNGFCGASPGQGYWHNGQEWCTGQQQNCTPQGSGPHGQGGQGGPSW